MVGCIKRRAYIGQIMNLLKTAGLGDEDDQLTEKLQQISGESLTSDDFQAEQGIKEFRNTGSEDDEEKNCNKYF